MANGDMIRELEQQAEKGNISTKAAISLILKALAQILDEQARQREEDKKVCDDLEHNPMVQLGKIIQERPKTVAVITVLVVLFLNTAGPLLIEYIKLIP